MDRILVIAEAGVNHNGDINLARDLIDAASEAGADYIKFQTFQANKLATISAPKAKYQEETNLSNESQFEMLKKLELSKEMHRELLNYSREKNIKFLSTAFDIESLEFLVNDLKLDINKIPSGEITNSPLLLAHARTSNRLILSTGMSSIEDIKEALAVIAFGLLNPHGQPTKNSINNAFENPDGQKKLQENVVLLHCTSEYPAELNDINLKAMQTLRDMFNLDIGYSDHSLGINVSIAAASLGATIIEKHLTVDNNLEGPDHKASLVPEQLNELVKSIREVEMFMGSSEKILTQKEQENQLVSRKSIVARVAIMQDEKFSLHNLDCKRPGDGLNPIYIWDLLGKRSKRNYAIDEQIIDE